MKESTEETARAGEMAKAGELGIMAVMITVDAMGVDGSRRR